MEALRVALALILPWAAGAALVLALTRQRDRAGLAVALGYGFFAGMLITALGMLALDTAGVALEFGNAVWVPAGMLAASAIAVLASGQRPPAAGPGPDLTRAQRAVFYALLGWIALRAAGLGVEVALNPLYAWDAWAQWVHKARVWFEHRALVPFVSADDWPRLAGSGAHTVQTWHYPPGVPLVQLWMALALGRWDESVINLPWLAAYVALGLAVYGQLRAWGASALAALVLAYLVLSLPLLNTHVAWAGIADLWVAALYGLAAMAALRWARDRDWAQGVLAAAAAGGLVLMKLPGLVWALTLLPALAVALAPRSWLALGTVAAGVVAVAILALVALFPELSPLERLGERLSATVTEPRWDVLGAFGENLYGMASWHLLWYALPVVMVLALPGLWRSRVHLAATLLLVEAAVFLIGVYVFTERAQWALDHTQLGRAIMHVSVFTVFYLGMLWVDGGKGQVRGPRSEGRVVPAADAGAEG